MQREQKKYIQAILSTYVRSTPSDLESALRLLAELKGNMGNFYKSASLNFCANLEVLILFSSSDGHWACWGSFKLHNLFVRCRPSLWCCFGNVRLQLSIDGCTAITKGKWILRTSLTSELRSRLAEILKRSMVFQFRIPENTCHSSRNCSHLKSSINVSKLTITLSDIK